MKLYHVTTGKKAKLYRKTGYIKLPVRGFDSILGATVWAMKTGRTVIYEIEGSTPILLPDHHNKWGKAYWFNENISNFKCIISPLRG